MKTFLKYALTGVVVLIAAGSILFKYWDQVVNPWTRDGQVRADVVQVTPRVSGPIVNLPLQDNQFVKTGELLFEIDPRTFQASLEQARANFEKIGNNFIVQEKQVDGAKEQVNSSQAQILQAQSAIKEIDSTIDKDRSELERQRVLLPQGATSQKMMDRAQANYDITLEKRKGALASLVQAKANLGKAEASLAEALATLGALGDANPSVREARSAVRQAELNLEFTGIRAPVDGYVTNLNLRMGSHAVANQPVLALVDVNSFWVHGFFKETQIEKISPGNKAIVTLMSYPKAPLEGYVDSIGWGIAQKDGSTGYNLLPNISPTFEWIRLAQRLPVRIHLTKVPEGVALRVGTTASVMVMTDSSTAGAGKPK
jgi:multidrug resistance efflux pump